MLTRFCSIACRNSCDKLLFGIVRVSEDRLLSIIIEYTTVTDIKMFSAYVLYREKYLNTNIITRYIMSLNTTHAITEFTISTMIILVVGKSPHIIAASSDVNTSDRYTMVKNSGNFSPFFSVSVILNISYRSIPDWYHTVFLH